MPRVVTQILQAHWDEAASMAVMEFKLGCGEFKVTSAEYGATADEGEHDIVLLVAHGSPMHQQSTHIVKPAVQWCSCGAWQDCMFPCHHACAVYRKWKEVDLNFVFTNLVDKNYTFGNVKNTFKRTSSRSVWMASNTMVLERHSLSRHGSQVGQGQKGRKG